MTNYDDVPKVWVEDDDTFEALALSWLNCQVLSIDTEFERRTTYYPLLALVQIFDGQKVYLIDPLKVSCPDNFRVICADQSITKIMHSCREDLEVLYHTWGCNIIGLFDTQIAYAFIEGEVSIGYASLVNKLCQVVIDKQETQSDWMLRPLSETQISYAAKDVLFLPELYSQLVSCLEQASLSKLFTTECDELALMVINKPDYRVDYRQAKDVWMLDSHSLYLFKQLYQWREETAIKTNRTKNHLFRDGQLVLIAKYKPQNRSEIRRIEGIHPRSLRIYYDDIAQIIKNYKEDQSSPKPHPELIPIPNPRDIVDLKLLTERLVSIVKQEAKKIGIATNILASKRVVKKVAYAMLTKEPMPLSWSGWRGKKLSPLFQSAAAPMNFVNRTKD